ncbi:MAG: DUF2029 domain-containing protein [Candidatus Rokubacteria bacterium]|nr:DUF2029 domain-containing protein [Candidatus Rokubacteria bacterium]
MPLVVLLAAGAGIVGACALLARLPNLVWESGTFLALFSLAFACYGAGLAAVARVPARRALPVVLLVAATARGVLLPASPTLSTDAYRYVWDARVASAGVSVYAYPPSAPELEGLRDATIYARLNHPTWRTIYPPGAQAFFRAVYALVPDSVLAMKAAVGAAELLTLAALLVLLRRMGVPATRATVYAWNPLVLVEVWGSGHLDGLAALAVVGALLAEASRRRVLAAALLGVGTLVKLYPAVLLPLLLGRRSLRAALVWALVVLAGYAPVGALGVDALGSLPRYLSEEWFNPGLARALLGEPALTLAAVLLWVGWATWRWRQAPVERRAFCVIAGFVILSPNIFPWYGLWLVPFLAMYPSLPWIAFTGTVALAYTFYLSEPWSLPLWARALEFAPLALGAAWALLRRLDLIRQPEPRRVDPVSQA